MILVVGATGLVGGEVCRLLASKQKKVRALARASSSPERTEQLRKLGVEVATGDIKDPASLRAACAGVETVVSTASATISRQAGDSIDSVDRQGQLNLVDAAKAAGVRNFIFVSFKPQTDIRNFKLQEAKLAVEERIRQSGMNYTILRPTLFMEVWLSPHAGFDPANGTARVYGEGNNKLHFVSLRDVARFAAAAAENPAAARNTVLELGGPDALSWLEVIRLFEELTGRKIQAQQIPVAAMEAQRDNPPDELSATLAALGILASRPDGIDVNPALERFPGKLVSVRDYARQVTGTESSRAAS